MDWEKRTVLLGSRNRVRWRREYTGDCAQGYFPLTICMVVATRVINIPITARVLGSIARLTDPSWPIWELVKNPLDGPF